MKGSAEWSFDLSIHRRVLPAIDKKCGVLTRFASHTCGSASLRAFNQLSLSISVASVVDGPLSWKLKPFHASPYISSCFGAIMAA